MGARDNILNGVIGLVTNILDEKKETKDILIIRRYEDANRPSNSITGSCDNYSKSVFGEISLDSLSQQKVCKGTYKNPCDNRIKRYSYKESIATLTLDFIGCGAFDVAELVTCHIELPELRDPCMPSYLGYYRHGNVVDVTALEEARHTERATFELEFIYACCAETDMPLLEFQDILKTNSCGDTYLKLEANIT